MFRKYQVLPRLSDNSLLGWLGIARVPCNMFCNADTAFLRERRRRRRGFAVVVKSDFDRWAFLLHVPIFLSLGKGAYEHGQSPWTGERFDVAMRQPGIVDTSEQPFPEGRH